MRKWQDHYKDKLITHKQAAKLVKPGLKVVFPLNGKPLDFGLALADRREELEIEVKRTGKKITVLSHWLEDFPFLHEGWEHIFDVKEGFISANTRNGIKGKTIDLSEKDSETGTYADTIVKCLDPQKFNVNVFQAVAQ